MDANDLDLTHNSGLGEGARRESAGRGQGQMGSVKGLVASLASFSRGRRGDLSAFGVSVSGGGV